MSDHMSPIIDINDLPRSNELLTIDADTTPFINFSQEPLQGVALQHLMARRSRRGLFGTNEAPSDCPRTELTANAGSSHGTVSG